MNRVHIFGGFIAALLFLIAPSCAFAQVYGGSTYGGGVFGTGNLPAAAAAAPSGGGGSQIVGSSPTAPGYINTNPTATTLGISPSTIVGLGATTTASTSSTSSSQNSSAPAITEAQIQSIVQLLQAFNADASVIANVTASLRGTTSGTSAASSNSSTFTRDLQLGDTGADVKALQQYLNSHGFVLAQSGPGSSGNETTTFGDATHYQLVQFQKTNGITPAAGYFGPKTRAFIAQ